MTDLKFHFKINGFFSKRKSMCIPVLSARLLSTLYCFSEVFKFVHYKYSLQPSRGIFVGTMFFCTYWVVYLPSLPFSFIKLSRTYRIFRYWKSLQCLLVFSLCWFTQVYAANNNGFICNCYNDRFANLTWPTYFQSQAKLALCAEFDCNGYGVNGA